MPVNTVSRGPGVAEENFFPWGCEARHGLPADDPDLAVADRHGDAGPVAALLVIATVCGRYTAMDRDKRWGRTQRAWDCLTAGVGERAATAAEAVALLLHFDELFARLAWGRGIVLCARRVD